MAASSGRMMERKVTGICGAGPAGADNDEDLEEKLATLTRKLEKEKENYNKEQQAHVVEIEGLKTRIQAKEKEFEKIKSAHETNMGSMKYEIDQVQSKLLAKKGAGGSGGQMEALVTQMEERNDGVKSELECPVCLDEMMPPRQIWMCQNGHSVCGECRPKVTKGCPSCKKSLSIRNIALEKIVMKLFL